MRIRVLSDHRESKDLSCNVPYSIVPARLTAFIRLNAKHPMRIRVLREHRNRRTRVSSSRVARHNTVKSGCGRHVAPSPLFSNRCALFSLFCTCREANPFRINGLRTLHCNTRGVPFVANFLWQGGGVRLSPLNRILTKNRGEGVPLSRHWVQPPEAA
jgi:hypothetical protein